VWVDQQSSQVAPWLKAVAALAGVVSPLSVLFPTGVANLIKPEVGLFPSVAAPYQNFVDAMNPAWQSSYTETTSELKEGSYTVKAVFEDRFAAFYRLYPAATVTISIKKIPSIKTALSDPTISQVFDQTIMTLAGQVQKDATACISIGRALELNQNFTHADAVYSLA
jgi:hypothetical protein